LTAFVDEEFPTTGIAGVNLYDVDPEARVRVGTVISAVTGNRKAVYTKAHAALAANAAVNLAANGFVTAAGAGYKTVRAMPIGQFGFVVSDAVAA
jgi:hypothetical protein